MSTLPPQQPGSQARPQQPQQQYAQQPQPPQQTQPPQQPQPPQQTQQHPPQPQYASQQYAQSPPPHPQYGQPSAQGYAQPIPHDPQQQYAPEQAYAQQQYAPPQRPRSDFNVLGLVALILTGAVAVIWSIAAPFALRALSEQAATTFDSTAFFLWRWLDVLVGGTLYLIALGLGIAGALAKARPRRRVLAHIAIGGAAVGLVVTVLVNVATQMAYGY